MAAPTLVPDKRVIQIESKKDIRKRIGRSTNKLDAVVMAWDPGETAAARKKSREHGSGQPAVANVGHAELKRSWRQ